MYVKVITLSCLFIGVIVTAVLIIVAYTKKCKESNNDTDQVVLD